MLRFKRGVDQSWVLPKQDKYFLRADFWIISLWWWEKADNITCLYFSWRSSDWRPWKGYDNIPACGCLSWCPVPDAVISRSASSRSCFFLKFFLNKKPIVEQNFSIRWALFFCTKGSTTQLLQNILIVDISRLLCVGSFTHFFNNNNTNFHSVPFCVC